MGEAIDSENEDQSTICLYRGGVSRLRMNNTEVYLDYVKLTAGKKWVAVLNKPGHPEPYEEVPGETEAEARANGIERVRDLRKWWRIFWSRRN